MFIVWYSGFHQLILSLQNCSLIMFCINAFLIIVYTSSKLNIYLLTWCDRFDCCCHKHSSIHIISSLYIYAHCSSQKLIVIPSSHAASHSPLLSFLHPPIIIHPFSLLFCLSHFLSALTHSLSTQLSTAGVRKMGNVMNTAFPVMHIHIQSAYWLTTGLCISASWAWGQEEGGGQRRDASACDVFENGGGIIEK